MYLYNKCITIVHIGKWEYRIKDLNAINVYILYVVSVIFLIWHDDTIEHKQNASIGITKTLDPMRFQHGTQKSCF